MTDALAVDGHHELTSLVLAPGFHGTEELFAPLLAALGQSIATRTAVVRYPDDLPATLDACVGSLESQLDRSQPFVLVGESFSGPVALECLRRDATGCRGLLLLATFATNPRPLLLNALTGWLVRPLLGIPPPTRALRHFLAGSDADGDLVAMLRPVARKLAPSTIAARLRVLRTLPAHEYAFGFPVHYLRATGDRVVPRRATRQCARRVANMRITDVPGSHLVAQHSPAMVASAIRDLLGET